MATFIKLFTKQLTRVFFAFSTSFLVALAVCAQSVSVKDIDASDSEQTTIEIKKGVSATPNKKQYEIVEDEAEVAGEPATLLKEARENWKKACESWRKEVRELNQENKILNVNCGKMNCSTAAMESTCVSQGKTKVRMLISE